MLLACLPYVPLVALLPRANDFPNEGGGEARMALGFQQFWAYAACGATLVLLWLALWRASRSGGIWGWGWRTISVLVPVAGAIMVFATELSFEQPGPWLPLVPTLLPPVIGAHALCGCVPSLSDGFRGRKLMASQFVRLRLCPWQLFRFGHLTPRHIRDGWNTTEPS